MRRTAKLFLNGRSQAVRLPVDFRFAGTEVFIHQEPETGNVILSSHPHSSWESFFALRDQTSVPDDFMSDRDNGPAQTRDLL